MPGMMRGTSSEPPPPTRTGNTPPSSGLIKSASYHSMLTNKNQAQVPLTPNASDLQKASSLGVVSEEHDHPLSNRSSSSKRQLKTRKTRFSIFGGAGQKGNGRKKKKPRRTKNGNRSSHSPGLINRDSFDISHIDPSRHNVLSRIFNTRNDVDDDMEEQDDCNAWYEELCCIRRAKTVEEKAEDTELFGRLGPPKKGEEEPGEPILSPIERADMSRQGTMILARLLILPFLLAILIAVDVYDQYNIPHPEISARGGNRTGYQRQNLPKAEIFFVPCVVQLLFNIFIVVASFMEWSFASSHRDRRRLQTFSYVIYSLGASIVEFSMFWPGFADSSVWILIGWIYVFSSASNRRCRDTCFQVLAVYILFNLLGLIWDDSAYDKIKMGGPAGTGIGRALGCIPWMFLCHIIYTIPETSSRASHRLKHKFSDDTAKLIEAAEGSKIILARVLPKELIPRVRKLQEGQAIADIYDNVTIIFGKIIGLHEMFDTLPTVQVVDVIDRLYRQIDNLINDKHTRIEKIKTVGDTYMAGSGLPTPTTTHAVDMAYFAFAFANEIQKFNEHYHLGTEGRAEKLDYKIGISSGKIVAGVIGKKNPVYDLWGDAANTASRMYSFGKKHHIQTTLDTIDLIKNEFNWKSRGKIQVKGKGLMECFFVLSPKNANKMRYDDVISDDRVVDTDAGGPLPSSAALSNAGVKENVIRRQRNSVINMNRAPGKYRVLSFSFFLLLSYN